jgi:hypothetical protein
MTSKKYNLANKTKKNNKTNKTKMIKQKGSGKLLDCAKDNLLNCKNPNMFFNNIKGTCWMISIFMILLMNDDDALLELSKFRTIDCDGNELDGKVLKETENAITLYLKDNIEKGVYDINELKKLPLDLKKSDKLFLIVNFFIELSNRLIRKEHQIKSQNSNKPIMRSRTPSMKSLRPSMRSNKALLENKLKEINSSTCSEFKLNKYFKLIFNDNSRCLNDVDSSNSNRYKKLECLGDFDNVYILILIISIFLCKKKYTHKDIYSSHNVKFKDFESEKIDNIIGIEIYIPGHVMCFYKCNNKLMFCSDSFIVEYDWKKLLLLYNEYNNNESNKEYVLIYNSYFQTNRIMSNEVYTNMRNDVLFYFKLKDNDTYYDINMKPLNDDYYKKIKIIKVEFLKSINISNKNSDLMIAIEKGNETNALEILKNPNCDVNFQDDENNTALMIAIKNGNETIALKILKNYYCNVNLRDNNDNTALMIAIEKGHEKIALEILKNPTCDVNSKSVYSNALTIALQKGNEKIALEILDNSDLNINFRTLYNMSALSIAIDNNLSTRVILTIINKMKKCLENDKSCIDNVVSSYLAADKKPIYNFIKDDILYLLLPEGKTIDDYR